MYTSYFSYVALVFCLLMSSLLSGQYDPLGISTPIDTDYQNCAAILVDGQPLIDQYSPDAICKLDNKQMDGTLTVSEVKLSEDSISPVGDPVAFIVAIRHKLTGTIWVYNQQPMTSVGLHSIIHECQDGDELIIMTMDKTIALPHNSIKMNLGC